MSDRGSFFKRKKYLWRPFCMVGLNMVVSIATIFVFRWYILNNNQKVHDVTLQGNVELATSMTGQLERYMIGQNDILWSTLDYIEMMEMTETEAAELIEHTRNLDGTLMLMKAGTYRGYAIHADDTSTKDRYDMAVGTNETLRAICDACKNGEVEDSEYLISDVYTSSETDEKLISYYQPFTMENETWVIIYELSLRTIIEQLSDTNPSITQSGMMLDADGMILYYQNPDNSPEAQIELPDNITDYFTAKYGSAVADDMMETIFSQASGSITQTDTNKQKQNYVFCHLGDDLNEGWIYIHYVKEESIEQSGSMTWPLMIMGIFVIIPWTINVVIMVLQNGWLRLRQFRIEQQNKELSEANKAQNAFISNMSHEIRTPINAVLGMDEMIIRETSEDNIREYAYDIKNAGKTLLGIINDILDFTKIQSGKMEIIEQEYEISSAVNDLINMIEVRARDKNLELVVNVNPQIPHMLYGDELRIKQIILNILTNAVKYTEKGSVTFNIDYEKLDEKYIMLAVSVRDTGIGMKEEEMDKLTKPFERLDEKRNRNIEGTGLGMSIVVNLLQEMNTKLEVESTYGVGSRFFFRLKQKVVDWEPMGDLETRYRDTRTSSDDTNEGVFHASRAQILVVDDTPVNLTVVKGLLKRTGARVDLAGSGEECIELCTQKKYHVILLDHRMPEMDGVETLHHLREGGENRFTPVIALTANAVSGAAEYYAKEGFNDFLSKPVNGTKLERTIAKYLPEDVLDTADDLATQIDSAAGAAASGSEEIYAQVCEEFAASAQKNIREISSFYEAGDIANYTIKVHALKSSARLVGATGLSKEALYLENCGNEGNIEEIQAKTADLLHHYEVVAKSFAKEENADKPPINDGDLHEALAAILEFSGAFDFDGVDSVMKQLSGYALPDDFAPFYERLQAAVFDVDQEQTNHVIQEYLGGKNNE